MPYACDMLSGFGLFAIGRNHPKVAQTIGDALGVADNRPTLNRALLSAATSFFTLCLAGFVVSFRQPHATTVFNWTG